jgi:hypothetical protein
LLHRKETKTNVKKQEWILINHHGHLPGVTELMLLNYKGKEQAVSGGKKLT